MKISWHWQQTPNFFYRNSFETDFVLLEGDSLVGLEVKSSGGDAKQLLKFKEKYKGKVKKLWLLADVNNKTIKGIRTMALWEYCLFHAVEWF